MTILMTIIGVLLIIIGVVRASHGYGFEVGVIMVIVGIVLFSYAQSDLNIFTMLH